MKLHKQSFCVQFPCTNV